MSPPFQGSGIPGPQGPQGPPGVGSQTLEEVLEQGSDAGNISITNTNNISANGNITVAGEVLNPIKIVGSTIPAKCVVENFDLRDASNLFPTNLTEGLGATLAAGTDGLNQPIANISALTLQNTAVQITEISAGVGQIIVSGDSNVECGTLVATNEVDTNVCKAAGSVQTPSLQVGPINGSQLFTAVENPSIPGSAIVGTSGSQSLIQSANIRATNQIQCFGPGASILMDGANTTFEGESVPGDGKTTFTNCDFTSSTNLFNPTPGQTTYGLYYSPLTTVEVDFDEEARKIFGSQVYCQWAPDSNYSGDWLCDVQFVNYDYGYGTVELSLEWERSDVANSRTLFSGSETFIQTHVILGGANIAKTRKVGVIQTTIVLRNLPTFGEYRFYPALRTNLNGDFTGDANDQTDGRMLLRFGQHSNNASPVIMKIYRPPDTFRYYNN